MKAKSSIPEALLSKQLEDVGDLEELAAMRRKPLKYKKLEEFLKEYSAPSAIVAKPIDKQLARKQKRY